MQFCSLELVTAYAGSVATQLLDQLKGLRPGHGSQHDMQHLPPAAPHPHHLPIYPSAPSEPGSAFGPHVSALPVLLKKNAIMDARLCHELNRLRIALRYVVLMLGFRIVP